VLAAASAHAKPARLAPLTVDQETVVAAIVHETFPQPRGAGAPLVLCLDVQLTDDAPVDERPARRRGRGRKDAPLLAPTPVIRGASQELVARLERPWRTVVSAAACRLDPLQPFTLGDATRTPARLVTVHLAPGATQTTTARIDWTSAGPQASAASSSRDCSATSGPRGWTIDCGGTWSQ
jgi:hypothetical protein